MPWEVLRVYAPFCIFAHFASSISVESKSDQDRRSMIWPSLGIEGHMGCKLRTLRSSGVFDSVDYCLQNDNGDLTAEANQQWWKEPHLQWCYLRSRTVVSPVCETFSAARLLPDVTSSLWGRTTTSLDLPVEFAQGLEPNGTSEVSLMRFILQMILYCGEGGRMCLVCEHPALSSLGSSPVVHHLFGQLGSCLLLSTARLHGDLFTLDQCIYGCPARKPTTLLLVRMSGMVECDASAWQILGVVRTQCGWHQALAGRDEHVSRSTPRWRRSTHLSSMQHLHNVLPILRSAMRALDNGLSPCPKIFCCCQSFEFVERTKCATRSLWVARRTVRMCQLALAFKQLLLSVTRKEKRKGLVVCSNFGRGSLVKEPLIMDGKNCVSQCA